MYIQVKDLGGKDRGLKFNDTSLQVFVNCLVASEEMFDDDNTIYATFFSGLVANSLAKNEEPDFTYDDVVEWVDKLDNLGRQEDIKVVCDKWAETDTWKTYIEGFTQRINEAIVTKSN